MNLSERKAAFVQLGHRLQNIGQDEFIRLAGMARASNGWFTEESIQSALHGLTKMLSEEQLSKWLSHYPEEVKSPKNIGVVMAGNIPFVGFHDLLSVLIAGHHLQAKLSSQDQVLMKFIIEELRQIAPGFQISMPDKLNDADAFIATGSDNSARYFHYYFGKKPHIIRKNRTSVALLTGEESKEDHLALAHDIFTYYGLGCRNVSKIYYPSSLNLNELIANFEDHSAVANHHKYRNNYDYNKSILLVNHVDHKDNGFLLLQESDALVSPISVLFTESYESLDECVNQLYEMEDKIQCVVGKEAVITNAGSVVPFGQAQQPAVWDYADGVDTMKFLHDLS